MTPLQILLIEDDRIFQAIIAKIADKNGFLVQIAENALVAMELLLHENFDLILLDDDGKIGSEIVQEIREKNAYTARVPIIVTGYDGGQQAARSLLLGANSFLKKPFTEKQLLAEIETLVL